MRSPAPFSFGAGRPGKWHTLEAGVDARDSRRRRRIEIVDTEEKIESFLPSIDAAIEEGLATVEKVEVRFYRSGGGG